MMQAQTLEIVRKLGKLAEGLANGNSAAEHIVVDLAEQAKEIFEMREISIISSLDTLSMMWLDAKQAEADATAERRKIEDRIKSLVGVGDNMEGTETVSPDRYTIKIAGRIDRKVDAEKLQELAAEHGLTDHLARLFRWTPEINMALWKAADESITRPLADAITAKAGRASFKITPKE
jgi:hypothetical protein